MFLLNPYKGLYTRAIEITTFCFEIGISLIWFVRFVAKFNYKAEAKTNTTQLALKFLNKTAPNILIIKLILNEVTKLK